MLDEKEDLVQERDSYKCKVHRLNHAMGALLKCDGHKLLDLDAILSENRFLRDSLDQVREEKVLANEMGRKYKIALEKSTQRKQRLPSSNNLIGGDTHSANSSPTKRKNPANICDDIRALMGRTSFPSPKDLDVTQPDQLQELSLALLETLNDRMMQFTQQKKANKQLMNRLEEIECQVQIGTNLEIGQLITNPSSFLMKGYSNANVDEDSFLCHNNVNAALHAINNKSSENSPSHGRTAKIDECGFSPDVAELYRRFQKLGMPSLNGANESSQQQNGKKAFAIKDQLKADDSPPKIHPPPDLIVQDFGPRGVSYHTESLSISDIENDDSDDIGDSSVFGGMNEQINKNEIILPDHLQQLVDRAMIKIVKDAEMPY